MKNTPDGDRVYERFGFRLIIPAPESLEKAVAIWHQSWEQPRTINWGHPWAWKRESNPPEPVFRPASVEGVVVSSVFFVKRHTIAVGPIRIAWGEVL